MTIIVDIYVLVLILPPPETNMAPEKLMVGRRSFPFGMPSSQVLSGSFREGTSGHVHQKNILRLSNIRTAVCKISVLDGKNRLMIDGDCIRTRSSAIWIMRCVGLLIGTPLSFWELIANFWEPIANIKLYYG